jgi:hypothetical protein
MHHYSLALRALLQMMPEGRRRRTAMAQNPNYPNISLVAALDAVRHVFHENLQNSMPADMLARQFGHESLCPEARDKIESAVAYGLIEDDGDELRLSADAVTAILAPVYSSDRHEALGRMAARPPLFQEIRKDFPNLLPSEENLRSLLIKRGFTAHAAAEATRSFLESVSLPAQLSTDGFTPEAALERVVFVAEKSPRQYLRLVLGGNMDALLLDALAEFVQRQRAAGERAKEA